MSPIPDDELISAYLDDELSREDRLRAEQLLLDRADLRRLFDELRGLRQGLRSLPKFSLGDEFSSSVLRAAEQNVSRSEGSSKSSAAETGMAAVPTPVEAPAPTAQAAQPQQARDTRPIVLPERHRALRPILYMLTTIAAALAIMFYQQGVRGPKEVALSPSQRDAKDGKHGVAATKRNESAAVKSSGATSVASSQGDGSLPSKTPLASTDAIGRQNDPDSRSQPAAPAIAAKGEAARGSSDAAGSMYSVDNRAADKLTAKTGIAPAAPAASAPTVITLPTPTVALGASREVDALPATAATPESLETIAVEDGKRLEFLVFNSQRARRADGTVDAVRLQALADSQALSDATADPTLRKQLASNGVELQSRGGWNASSGLVVVNLECDRETIDREFTRVLQDQRIDNLSAAIAGRRGFANEQRKDEQPRAELPRDEPSRDGRADPATNRVATESEKVHSGADRGLAGGNRIAASGSGTPGNGTPGNSVPGGVGAGGAGFGGAAGNSGLIGKTGSDVAAQANETRRKSDQSSGQRPLGWKWDSKNETGEVDADEEYEYVYVVAKRDELQSVLNTVRAESKLFNKVSVEAAMPQLVAADQRRGGYRDSTADSKNQAAAGSKSADPSAAVALSAATPPAAKAAKLPEAAMPTAPTAAAAAKPVVSAKPMAASQSSVPATPAGPATAAGPAAAMAMPKSAPSGTASIADVAAPATPPPTSVPGVMSRPTAPQAAPSPGSNGPLAAGRPSAAPGTDQPIAPSERRQNNAFRLESQSYGAPRSGYVQSQSRWQRSSDRLLQELQSNQQQVEGERSNSYAVTNPVAEKSQIAAGVSSKLKEAGKLSGDVKKSGEAPSETVDDTKIADPKAAAALGGGEGETKRSQAGGSATPNVSMPASQALADGDRNANVAEAKPTDLSDPSRKLRAANDEAAAKQFDSQSGGGRAMDIANSTSGGGFIPAPPMLPTQQFAPPQQSAAPEDLLGKITGVQEPPPIVQQRIPAVTPNRIRGVVQEEQVALQDDVGVAGELPPDYQEVLFVFRVVKKDGAGNVGQVESDSTNGPKPAKQ